jgi:hypothetical protein
MPIQNCHPIKTPLRRRLRAGLALSSAACLLLAACGDAGSPPQAGGTQAAPTSASSAAAPWRPAADATWQWQLSGTINTAYAVSVYDIDLFDAPVATIALLHSRGQRVVCYLSAGTAENWRPDYARFAAAEMGKPVDGWPGERWLDTRSPNVRTLLQQRLDLAVTKGCDGVEPDNVDAYLHDSGFALDAATQLDFNRFLAREAHARGLAVGLKNDVDQLAELAADFDFAVNEQCFQFSECGGYEVFTRAGKPVFNAEYDIRYVDNAAGERDALCAAARAARLRTLVLPPALDDSLRHSCD